MYVNLVFDFNKCINNCYTDFVTNSTTSQPRLLRLSAIALQQ